jgi:hypothetical protein
MMSETNECVVEYPREELDEELTFEVSKHLKVTTKVKYKKGDVIESLVNEIENLKKEIDDIKKVKKVLVTEETLIQEWENKDDSRWDQC